MKLNRPTPPRIVNAFMYLRVMQKAFDRIGDRHFLTAVRIATGHQADIANPIERLALNDAGWTQEPTHIERFKAYLNGMRRAHVLTLRKWDGVNR
jgi:hypothetical protein